jgi:hypothetical protein
MRRRLEHVLTLVCFLTVILSPWIAGALGLRASPERENRRFEPVPELSPRDVLDSERFAAVEAFVTDRLPLRQEYAAWINDVLYRWSGESPVADAFVTRDGLWTLSEDYLDACAAFPAPLLQERIDEWETASGGAVDVVLVVAPDKSSIRNAELGPRSRLADNCQVQRERDLTQALGPGGDLVDLWTPLRARHAAGERGLYFTHDSHWTGSGAVTLAESLVDAFVPGLFDATVVEPADRATVTGDVTARLGWERDETIDRLISVRPGVDSELTMTPTPSGQGVRSYSSTARGPGDPAPFVAGRTVVVHDSMGNYAEGMLAPYFEHVRFVNWNDLAAGEFLPLVAGADRIVFQTVQRAMGARIVDPLLSPSFDEALRAALG